MFGHEFLKQNVPTVIANLQAELQTIKDLASIAPTLDQRESLLQTAKLVEQCVRDFDRQV